MTGLQTVGVIVVANGLIIGVALLINRTIDWKVFLALEAAFVIAAIVVSNLGNISTVGVKSGDKAFNLQMERVENRAKEVEAIANEIRAAKDSIQLLVHNANLTNDKLASAELRVGDLLKDAVTKREQLAALTHQTETAANGVKLVESNVTQMRNDVRQTLRSIFESMAFVIGTKNLFPPPPSIGTEIDRHLNILAVFAYPDAKERSVEINRIMAHIQEAQKNPSGKKD